MFPNFDETIPWPRRQINWCKQLELAALHALHLALVLGAWPSRETVSREEKPERVYKDLHLGVMDQFSLDSLV